MSEQKFARNPIKPWDGLREGRVSLFLGDGINHGAGGVEGMPTRAQVVKALAVPCGYPAGAPLAGGVGAVEHWRGDGGRGAAGVREAGGDGGCAGRGGEGVGEAGGWSLMNGSKQYSGRLRLAARPFNNRHLNQEERT